VSSDLVHAANDAWWQEQLDLGISRSTRACRSTVLDRERVGVEGRESDCEGGTETV
jgi:hypothetical protein